MASCWSCEDCLSDGPTVTQAHRDGAKLTHDVSPAPDCGSLWAVMRRGTRGVFHVARGGSEHHRNRSAREPDIGEIYPSIVDVPRPGCWHVTLRWGPNTAELNLNYQPS